MTEFLTKVLYQFGVEFRSNKRSFILKYCPSCGRNKNSVWMFRPDSGTRTGGCCWVCGTKFSTYSYLVECGNDPKEVRESLGIGRQSPDLRPESWNLPDFNVEENASVTEDQAVFERAVPEHFHKVWDWPQHPAGKYARSRGVIGALSQGIYIDPMANAVAFPIYCHGKMVGFQRRFVSPTSNLKVKTDGDIPKARSFITIGTIEQPICVVEGPFDAVAACWFGYYGVCTMGASISKTQAQEIAMMAFNQNPENPMVYIGLDADEPGEVGSRGLARLLDAYGVGFKRISPESGFKDLGEALEKGGGLDLLSQEEFLNIDGLVREVKDWHWSSKVLEGFRYKIGIDYSWKDFKEETDRKAQNRQKHLNRLQREDPEKYRLVMKIIEEREEKRAKRLKIEGLFD